MSRKNPTRVVIGTLRPFRPAMGWLFMAVAIVELWRQVLSRRIWERPEWFLGRQDQFGNINISMEHLVWGVVAVPILIGALLSYGLAAGAKFQSLVVEEGCLVRIGVITGPPIPLDQMGAARFIPSPLPRRFIWSMPDWIEVTYLSKTGGSAKQRSFLINPSDYREPLETLLARLASHGIHVTANSSKST